LFDLSEFLPKKPSDVDLKVMKEMFEASVDGKPYDLARWGQYFRPAGMNAPQGSAQPAAATESAAPASRPAPAADPSPWEDDVAAAEQSFSAPVAKPAPAAGGQSAQDILAMIRARQK
jgi:hypothetical protein